MKNKTNNCNGTCEACECSKQLVCHPVFWIINENSKSFFVNQVPREGIRAGAGVSLCYKVALNMVFGCLY